MTFQPPPPPPGGSGSQPPPGPPPGGYGPPAPQGGYQGQQSQQPPQGQWGPPPGQPQGSPGGAFDPKSVDQLDWGILGAGALAFIFSFVSYYTFDDGRITLSENAWNGFFGWFAMLAALVGSGALAMEIFAPQVKLPFPNRLIGLGAYAVSLLCVILALFVIPDYQGIAVPDSINTGHGFGYWVSLIVIIAGAVLSLLRFQRTGGQLPSGMGGHRRGVGGSGTGSGPGMPPPPHQ